MLILKCLVFSFIIISCMGKQTRSATLNETKAGELIYDYLDLLRSGNFESAAGLWEPSCREQALRLGLVYDNIPVKADCASPYVYDYENLKDYLAAAITSKAVLDSTTIRWKLESAFEGKEVSYFYYTSLIDDYYWIIPPHYYYSQGWPTMESKYFRFIINPDLLNHANEISVRSLDEIVEKIAAELMIPEERLAVLAEKKIDYYLCRDEVEVGKLAGTRGQGFYNRGFDVVITSFMPNYHEVSLLMINFKLQNQPQFTIPFIREGLATIYGGCWQRAPEVVFDFGGYILRYDIIKIDSILTYDQFNDKTNGDITNPVGACLVNYLYRQLGVSKFFDLYRSLSGDHDFVSGLTTENVKQMVETAMEKKWPDIEIGFFAFMEECRNNHGLIYPGQVETDRVLIDKDGLVLSASDKYMMVEYTDGSDLQSGINILLKRENSLAKKSSILFDEQYKDSYDFEGYRFGIRLDKNEIGLYDYATNQIRAKFIDDPGIESPYYDTVSHKIRAYFDIGLIGEIAPQNGDYKILK